MHTCGALEVGRCLPSGRGVNRASTYNDKQHWPPEGKRSGERKWPTFHPPRSGAICAQPDPHWPCFESNPWGTAERRSGAHMGLSEHYHAILTTKSQHWSPEGKRGGERNRPTFHPPRSGFVVCWLLNAPTTGQCISGTDLHRQFYVLPH